MGVSGAGKSTVGTRLARELGWRFIEGDDLHPPANIEKMARGERLTDADRRGWLAELAGAISSAIESGENVVVASSALKQRYRDQLRVDAERVTFVFLRGEPDLIAARLADRREHFAGAELLPSQFEALEEPDDVPAFDVSAPLASIVDGIREELDA
ncbi:MAG: gluconokinase [Solirubrobacterales bacterium]